MLTKRISSQALAGQKQSVKHIMSCTVVACLDSSLGCVRVFKKIKTEFLRLFYLCVPAGGKQMEFSANIELKMYLLFCLMAFLNFKR